MNAIANRYEFVFLFDVENGNPNGDPDAGNMPRLDPDTSHGLVTDVCLKRKVRNYVALAKEESPGYRIYMNDGGILNNVHSEAYEAIGEKPVAKKLPKEEAKARQVTRWMCDNFWDIRAFGAVMSTEVNAGQVRGPLQLTFSESLDPIVPTEHSITRSSVTNEKDADKERTMGRKYTVPYALYRCHGFVNARLANATRKLGDGSEVEIGTGLTEDDLEIFWHALLNMFDHDRSAARGEMTARGLIVFKHQNDLGNAPARKLFDSVTVKRWEEDREGTPPTAFEDYEIVFDEAALPDGIEAIRML
ncbi:MAG: type I-C CRISPR-associated protein Cas7/Csd2 [Pseudomonadota bacterium]